MAVKVHCLGGFREVGRNAALIEGKSKNIMCDYGIKVENGSPPQPFKGKVDGLFITHGHLDHLGLSPLLYKQKKCPIYVTGPTADLSGLLLKDSLKIARMKGMPLRYAPADVTGLSKHQKIIHHGDTISFGKTKVNVWDAGHIPGSCMFVVRTDGKKILYTGDFKIKGTRMVTGARFDLKNIDAVLMETTYSSKDHPPRKEVEKKLFKEVKETVNAGGIALLPSFAIRAPELLMVLDHFGADFPIYLDGMAKAATSIFQKYPEFIKDPAALNSAVDNVIPLYSQEERNNALKEPCAIVNNRWLYGWRTNCTLH